MTREPCSMPSSGHHVCNSCRLDFFVSLCQILLFANVFPPFTAPFLQGMCFCMTWHPPGRSLQHTLVAQTTTQQHTLARELVVVWLFGRPRCAVMTCQVAAVSCKNTCLIKRGQKKGVEARANCPSHKTFYTKANTQPHDTPRYLIES